MDFLVFEITLSQKLITHMLNSQSLPLNLISEVSKQINRQLKEGSFKRPVQEDLFIREEEVV